MLDASQIGTLLGASNANSYDAVSQISTLLGKDNDLAKVTSNVLSAKLNVQQTEDTVSFTQELQNYITENVSEADASKLLSDLQSIQRLNDLGDGKGAASQLLGTGSNEAGNIVDLLV